MTDIDRRHFVGTFLACAVGASAFGQIQASESDVDINSMGLSKDQLNRVKRLWNKLDDLDKQVLQKMSQVDNGSDAFCFIAETHGWNKIYPGIKQRIIDDAVIKCHIPPSPLNASINASNFKIIYGRSNIYNIPTLIRKENIDQWIESRPVKPSMTYITLPDNLTSGLTEEQACWVKELVYWTNDNLNTIITTPSLEVARETIASGAMNGKTPNHIAGVFPCLESYTNADDKTKSAEWQRQSIERALDRRHVPANMRKLYTEYGYVGVLSDFDGQITIDSYCEMGMIKPCQGGSARIPICFLNNIFYDEKSKSVPSAVVSAARGLLAHQKKQQNDAESRFKTVLTKVGNQKGLSMKQQGIAKYVAQQANALLKDKAKTLAMAEAMERVRER